MWQCQLHVWTSSVDINWLACYLIILELIPTYERMKHDAYTETTIIKILCCEYIIG